MDIWSAIPPQLAKRARRAAEWVPKQGKIAVVHHIDADGVSAGAISLEALARAGHDAIGVPTRSLDDVSRALIHDAEATALWFCDFGSTAYMQFERPKLVCDHHELVRDGTEEDFPHVNPLLDELDGSHISGAGCAFLVALAMDEANVDLLPLALVGATGDMQDRRGGFAGSNLALQQLGLARGILDAEEDLAFFGSESRPVRNFLAYGEPGIPGLFRSKAAAEALCNDAGVELRPEPSWATLSAEQRRAMRSTLVERLIDCGLPVFDYQRTVLRIAGEQAGTPVRELQEFATLLNSTARYDEPETGIAVARGDRGDAFQAALGLRDDHRKNLMKSLDAFAKCGVQETDALQWVNLEHRVRDTVVGIVAGMALDGLGLRRDKPIIAFANTPEGATKVSSRAPHEIQGRIDLAVALREAAAVCGGVGGGHKGAAGATIERGRETEFLTIVNELVAKQLGIQRQAVPPAKENSAVEAPPPGTWSRAGAGQQRL